MNVKSNVRGFSLHVLADRVYAVPMPMTGELKALANGKSSQCNVRNANPKEGDESQV